MAHGPSRFLLIPTFFPTEMSTTDFDAKTRGSYLIRDFKTSVTVFKINNITTI